jgi:DNA-binding MarR family transcriptional regulator
MIYDSMILDIRSAGFDEALRVSRLLFGNQDRLLVAVAVAAAEAGSIYARNIAEQIGITDNRVTPQLASLEAAGLLMRMPKVGGERRVYYERAESSFWTFCTDLAAELATRESTR